MIGLVVVVVLVVLAGLAVAWPVIAARADTAQVGDADPVQEELDRRLDEIREIELDHAIGHLSDDDFKELDAEARARALALLRTRDARTGDKRAEADVEDDAHVSDDAHKDDGDGVNEASTGQDQAGGASR